jgi:hypothetical protein
MSGIGHNNPPSAFEMLQIHIEDLISLADGCLTGDPIDTQEKADAIEALKDDIKKARKDVEAARVEEKKPHDEAAKAVQAKYKPLLDRADIAASTAANALTPWLVKQQEERDRIAREKREEAERLAGKAKAQFQDSNSTDLESRLNAEEALKQAKKAAAVANKVDRQATGLRSYWTAAVSDYGALLAYLKKDKPGDLRAMLYEYAEKQKNMGVRSLAGVEFKEEKRAV